MASVRFEEYKAYGEVVVVEIDIAVEVEGFGAGWPIWLREPLLRCLAGAK